MIVTMAYDEDAAEHLLLGAAVLGGDQLADPVGEMRGREMNGWLRVDAESVATKRELEPWVTESVAFARTLPPKKK